MEERHPAFLALEALKLKTGMGGVRLCVFEGDESQMEVFRTSNGIDVITLSSFSLKNFSVAAFEGALGHEFGHIIIARGNKKYKMIDEQRVADSIAISLVGEKAVLEAYLAHTGNLALAKRRVAQAKKK